MKLFNSLSPVIRDHVKLIAKTSGLPVNDESYELLASAWLDKKQCFEDALPQNSLEETAFFDKDNARGALVLTYSGSLLNIGPLVDGKRRAEYASIGLRTDVPAAAVEDSSLLSADIEIDAPAVFSKGPIRQSSPVFKIAIATADLTSGEEEELLTRISREVTEDFVEVNKTIIQ